MTKGSGIFFFYFFLGILSSLCDLDMIDKLFSLLFGTVNFIFISFGLGLSDDGSDLFLLITFSGFSVSLESVPVLLSEFFISGHCYPFSLLFY